MNKTNQNITFKGNKITILGNELKEGQVVPDFQLTANDMSDLSINNFKGKVVIISTIPSLDTPVCSIETKRFNEEASNLSDSVVILTVSRDLPFAQKRWCAAEGVSKVVTASDYKHRSFGSAFGVEIKELGLLARAIFVVGKDGKITHTEYVQEIAQEPDYSLALNAAKKALETSSTCGSCGCH